MIGFTTARLAPKVKVMDVVLAAVPHLNPGRTPVLAMNQLRFALTEEIQWTYPDKKKRVNFVAMLGGFDVEMTAVKMYGDWLNGGEWTSIFTRSGMALSGVAEFFLKTSHLTRTRHTHRYSGCSVHPLTFSILEMIDECGFRFEN